MTDTTPPAPPRWLAWMPAVAACSTIFGGLAAGGSLIADVRQNKVTAELQARDIREMRERLARVEVRQEMQDRGARP
ncbi:hypothetical protein [Sphingomonas sp. SAFR-052]|uniref:hypothetical protein n=1 Tax=Sphingomonas sp. SAFR-052 TaxID=3436867 RepID=UPI003F810713